MKLGSTGLVGTYIDICRYAYNMYMLSKFEYCIIAYIYDILSGMCLLLTNIS